MDRDGNNSVQLYYQDALLEGSFAKPSTLAELQDAACAKSGTPSIDDAPDCCESVLGLINSLDLGFSNSVAKLHTMTGFEITEQ